MCRCWGAEGPSGRTLDVIEEFARRTQLGASPDHERRDREREIAAEGGEPSGDEADEEAPRRADEKSAPRDAVAREVLLQEIEREFLGARADERPERQEDHEDRACRPGRDPEGALVQGRERELQRRDESLF